MRLVTLLGPGGIGKPRLAIAAGHERQISGATVTWVPLAAARSAPAALSTVAAALGLEDRGAIPLLTLLAQALRRREQFLIADNLEQIPDLAPELGRLLAAAPALTVLATSRAPLQPRGERRYHVPPLELGASPGGANPSPAIALFARRALEIDHPFDLTSENEAVVQAICGRLDGLPLAIGLAAARSVVLSPTALLARLDRALPLLTVGSHDAPDRQRTLRDAIAWSYHLLPPDSHQVFRQLGVFMGGFTLPAAQQVCAPASGTPVLDYLQVLFTSDDVRAFSILDAEDANSSLALATLADTPGRAEFAAELCTLLNVWWQLRARGQEALAHLDGLLARRDELPLRAVANLLIEASNFRNVRGEDIAEGMAREAVEIREALRSLAEPDFRSLSTARFDLADCLFDPVERHVHYEIWPEYAQPGNQGLAEAFLLGSLCLASGELGQIAEAMRAETRAIALQPELGGRIGIGQAHSQLGPARRLLDRHAEAIPYLTTAFRNFWEIGAIGWTAQCLEGLAACAAHAQQAERAAWLIGAASRLRFRNG